jgi:hypothetical protein
MVDSGQDRTIYDLPHSTDQHMGTEASYPFDKDGMAGDEGVEEHLVFEEGPFSPFPSPDEDSSLECSMFVEPGSRELSMESSLATLPSRNSSVFALCGGWADSFFISTPLRLTPEVPYCYPRELPLS